jgi:hypothetical protein
MGVEMSVFAGLETLKMREKAVARAVESPEEHARMHARC